MAEISFIQYIIFALIIYSSLIFGRMLARLAPEEMQPGKWYLIILQKVFFALVLIAFALCIENIYIRGMAAALLLFFLYEIGKHNLNNNNAYLVYTFFGMFLGSTGAPLIFYPAALAFLFGLPTGSLLSYLKGRNALFFHLRILAVLLIFTFIFYSVRIYG